MAKSPKKSSELVVYPKQWPSEPRDKMTVPDDTVTGHLGHEYRMRRKFSEWVHTQEQTQREKPKSARETFPSRFRVTRAKHMPHPAPIQGGHYKSTPQMEKPHYEELQTPMNKKTFREALRDFEELGEEQGIDMGRNIEEAKERTPAYVGTVRTDDPEYKTKVDDLKKKAGKGGTRVRGRDPKPEYKSMYRKGGELYRSSSKEIKPEHSNRVDVYKKKTMKEAVEQFRALVESNNGDGE